MQHKLREPTVSPTTSFTKNTIKYVTAISLLDITAQIQQSKLVHHYTRLTDVMPNSYERHGL